jgi:integrase
MATIENRGKGSYRLTVELGYGPDGKRIRRRKMVYAKDFGKEDLGKRELQKELEKFSAEVQTGQYIDLEKMPFEAFVREWQKRFVEKQLEEKTQQNYSNIVEKRIIPHFGSMGMEKIKSLHVMDFIDKLGNDGLASNSIVKYYRVLKSIFHWAKEWKIIKDNPMDGVPKPKEIDYDADIYSEEEVVQLFEALQHEKQMFQILITLAVTTGLRRGELLGLEWKHIHIDKAIEKSFIEVKQSIPMYKDGQPVIKEPKTKNSIRKVSAPSYNVPLELDTKY